MISTKKSSENSVNIKKENKIVTRLLGRRRKITPSPQYQIDSLPNNNDNLSIKDETCHTISSSTHSTISHQNIPSKNNNINRVNNKIDLQIGLCCTIDNRARTPEKLSVKYKSLPDIDLQNANEAKLKHFEVNKETPELNLSQNQELSLNQYFSVKSNKSSLGKCKSSSNFIDPISDSSQIYHSQKSPIINEPFQRSIAISACRSRFRANILANTDNSHKINPSINVDAKCHTNEMLTNQLEMEETSLLKQESFIQTEKSRKR